MVRRLNSILWVLAVLIGGGCGGDDDGGGPPTEPGGSTGGGNFFAAKIDGVSWSSDSDRIQVTGNTPATRPGTLVLSGYNVSNNRGVQLTLSFIIGPASQPLGVNPGTNPGGTGGLILSTDSWLTPLNGAAGFINITARTDKRIAGSFNFTADGILPSIVPPQRVVTEGAFDITIDAGLPPLPTGVGSTSIATIGGTPWNAATIVGSYAGPGVFALSVGNTSYMIVFTPATPVSAGNVYGIPSQVTMQVTRQGTADGWAAVTGPDIGSFSLTTFNVNRLIATYNATLPKLGGGAPLAITGGTINAYLEN
jgi:hypothetical protein